MDSIDSQKIFMGCNGGGGERQRKKERKKGSNVEIFYSMKNLLMRRKDMVHACVSLYRDSTGNFLGSESLNIFTFFGGHVSFKSKSKFNIIIIITTCSVSSFFRSGHICVCM